MPARPGTAARSAAPAAARDRAWQRPGSGGPSPPPSGTPGRAARPESGDSSSAGSAAPAAPARARTCPGTGGRPGAPGQAHLFLTRRRCQASTVPGVTIARARAAALARAAMTARSAQSGLGRATRRRTTATSRPSTTISASFAASSRARSTSQPDTRTMNRSIRPMTTSHQRRTAGQAHTLDSGPAQATRVLNQPIQQRGKVDRLPRGPLVVVARGVGRGAVIADLAVAVARQERRRCAAPGRRFRLPGLFRARLTPALQSMSEPSPARRCSS
jgi:hypothetical protein